MLCIAPYFIKGTGYTDCVTLNKTHKSIRAFEDQVSPTIPCHSLTSLTRLTTCGLKEIGYCHFFLFSDDACKNEVTSDDTLDGHCEDSKDFLSFRASCYR